MKKLVVTTMVILFSCTGIGNAQLIKSYGVKVLTELHHPLSVKSH